MVFTRIHTTPNRDAVDADGTLLQLCPRSNACARFEIAPLRGGTDKRAYYPAGKRQMHETYLCAISRPHLLGREGRDLCPSSRNGENLKLPCVGIVSRTAHRHRNFPVVRLCLARDFAPRVPGRTETNLW